MTQVKNVKEIRCYYLERGHNYCRLENYEEKIDEKFDNVNYISVRNTKSVNTNLFPSEAPARPDLIIEFDKPTMCKVNAYGDYDFDELKIIYCE